MPGSYTDIHTPLQELEKLRKAIQRYKKIGVDVYITESLVDLTDYPGDMQSKEQFQAWFYYKLVQLCAQEGVSFNTYATSNDPTIYPQGAGRTNAFPYYRDENYQPILSYYTMTKALVSK